MDPKLFAQAITKFLGGLVLVGLLLFVPAGTFAYPQAWLLIGILFVPMFVAGLIMMKKSPDLLRRRLNAREGQSEQRSIIALSGLMFLAGYALYAEVLRENVWRSRTVEVQEDQKVIDTGLYGVVRHPMYMSTLILFLSMPLVLGSVISFAIMLMYIPIIAWRIRGEERVLEAGLAGYAEYRKRVRYKVIPYVW